MCPATPSSRPARLNIRNAAASLALRCARSSSTVSKVCGLAMRSGRPSALVMAAAAGACSVLVGSCVVVIASHSLGSVGPV